MDLLRYGKHKVNIGDLIISFLINLGIPTAIGWLIFSGDTQYEVLKKPFSIPPTWSFKVVWFILYTLMAIASYRIYEYTKKDEKEDKGLLFYSIQLIINFIWPFVFFKLQLYGISFILILILIILSIITEIKFFKVDRIAGLLFIPYILWLQYAAVLCFYIWKLNEM